MLGLSLCLILTFLYKHCLTGRARQGSPAGGAGLLQQVGQPLLGGPCRQPVPHQPLHHPLQALPLPQLAARRQGAGLRLGQSGLTQGAPAEHGLHHQDQASGQEIVL